MKVNLINFEQGFNTGILSKFAYKMHEELNKIKGVKAVVSKAPDPKADVNHSINYLPYKYVKTINTLMVTHIWTGYKLSSLADSLKTADIGVCMSDHTRQQLIKWGLPEEKLAVILPAHDGTPRRFQVVSILTNVYPDNCKREEMFTALVKTLDLKKWAFRIMGSGWQDILVPLVADGLQVDYFPQFDPENYQKILVSSDYNLYFGMDEGSMGVLDAKNAGLKIIAPPVGFHIDIGVDYPFHSQEELNQTFALLSENPVESWIWPSYAKQHLNLWKKLRA